MLDYVQRGNAKPAESYGVSILASSFGADSLTKLVVLKIVP